MATRKKRCKYGRNPKTGRCRKAPAKKRTASRRSSRMSQRERDIMEYGSRYEDEFYEGPGGQVMVRTRAVPRLGGVSRRRRRR